MWPGAVSGIVTKALSNKESVRPMAQWRIQIRNANSIISMLDKFMKEKYCAFVTEEDKINRIRTEKKLNS